MGLMKLVFHYSNFMGQLLVVAHQTAYEPSLCYEPELIPDPLCYS